MNILTRRKLPEILLRLYEVLLQVPCSTLCTRGIFRLWGATVGRDLRVAGRVRTRLLGEVRIGDRVQIRSGYANFVGAGEPVGLWVGPGGRLSIGDDCALSNLTIVCLNEVRLLEGTFVGGGSRIYDTDFHQLPPEDRLLNRGTVGSAPVCIGPRAFVGGHCTILKGVTIGEGAIVGAGGLVTRNIPSFEIWAGVPARKIGDVQRLGCKT